MVVEESSPFQAVLAFPQALLPDRSETSFETADN